MKIGIMTASSSKGNKYVGRNIMDSRYMVTGMAIKIIGGGTGVLSFIIILGVQVKRHGVDRLQKQQQHAQLDYPAELRDL